MGSLSLGEAASSRSSGLELGLGCPPGGDFGKGIYDFRA